MTLGYGGTYRGSVVDNADPLGQNRLLVLVPEVYGTESAWAMPSLPPGSDVQLPAPGDDVWITFERGAADSPVWQASAPAESTEPPSRGLVGKYRGRVVDNADPMGQNRLLVSVPDVYGTESAWATPAVAGVAGDIQVPAIDEEVWIEFEDGDPEHPTWVGIW